uniref:Uncharacterized protein n=1 Tax=Salix viminalis TaxID=40686 RepID=A0A6N2MJB9_SALVM
MYGFELYKAGDHELQRLTSTSLVDESSVCGRHDEKKIIITMLLAESSQEARDMDVISLVGLGGIGKTTLAQLAFNDAKVTAHFEKKMWVCVSEPFDGVRIAKVILEQLKVSTSNLDDLQSLLPKVSQSINRIRILLVLDDVWTEDHRHWEQLKPSLAGCARGSRILVTTRKGAVAAMMGTDHQIDIETLCDAECRSIFNHVAFYKRSKEERERLTDIGNKIANKCRGLPLAAKVLGGLMQSKKTREEWEDVLSNELWGLDEVDKVQVEKKLFLPLLLSYYDLPSVVRRCFLYCAMFPKDYEMKKDELVKMWMAQGYVKGTGRRDMEVVGEQYFQPPSDLERLHKRYGGIVLPNWMMALTRLQDLELIECGNLKVLPPLGRLPNLESLVLKEIGVRNWLDVGFLGIEEVENANINEGEIARVTAFPN